MKKIFIYTAILIMSAMTSCYHLSPCVEGYGIISEDIRDVDDFYSVSNTTSFDVYVSQADTFSVIVNAQANLFPVVETYTSGGTLIIKTREFTCVRNTSTVEIYVTLPEIEEFHLTGSGTIVSDKIEGDIMELTLTSSGRMIVDTVYCDVLNIRNSASGEIRSNEIDANYTEVKISGSGDVDLGALFAEEFYVTHSSSGNVRGGIYNARVTDLSLSGSGRIILEGDSEYLYTSNSASGRIDALDLFAIDVRSHSSGSGNTYVNVSGLLDVTILGSGDVVYVGSPTETKTRITGSGNLRIY